MLETSSNGGGREELDDEPQRKAEKPILMRGSDMGSYNLKVGGIKSDFESNTVVRISQGTFETLHFPTNYAVLGGKDGKESICCIYQNEQALDGVIYMPLIIQNNLRVRSNDIVSIRACPYIIAKQIHILPFADTVEGITGNMYEVYLKPYFLESECRPMHFGDIFKINHGIRAVEFKVVGIDPFPFSIVKMEGEMNDTIITCEGEPIQRGTDDPPRGVLIPLNLSSISLEDAKSEVRKIIKIITGQDKCGWGKAENIPNFWPNDVPYADIRTDTRVVSENQKSWRDVLVDILIKGYGSKGKLGLLSGLSPTEILTRSLARGDLVEMAKLANEKRHYANAVQAMKKVLDFDEEVSAGERNLLFEGYRNVLILKRKEYDDIKWTDDKPQFVRLYQEAINIELKNLSEDILDTITKWILPKLPQEIRGSAIQACKNVKTVFSRMHVNVYDDSKLILDLLSDTTVWNQNPQGLSSPHHDLSFPINNKMNPKRKLKHQYEKTDVSVDMEQFEMDEEEKDPCKDRGESSKDSEEYQGPPEEKRAKRCCPCSLV